MKNQTRDLISGIRDRFIQALSNRLVINISQFTPVRESVLVGTDPLYGFLFQ